MNAVIAEPAPQFCFSIITSVRDTRARPQGEPWDDFVVSITKPPRVRGSLTLEEWRANPDALDAAWKGQKNGPAIIAGQFAPGGGRCDVDVTAMTGLVLDFDKGGVEKTTIEKVLDGIAFVAHTSYSHHPEAPRWRVIIPFKTPVSPAQYRAVWETFQRRFQGRADTTGRPPSHAFYIPAVPPGGERFFDTAVGEGDFFDALSIPAAVAVAAEASAPAGEATAGVALSSPAEGNGWRRIWSGRLLPGERNAMLFKYASRLRALGFCREELAHILSAANTRQKAPLDGAELQGIAASAAQYEPGRLGAKTYSQENGISLLNKNFATAVLPNGSPVVVAFDQDAAGRQEVNFLPQKAFVERVQTLKCQVGRRLEPLARVWLEAPGHRHFAGVAFDPSENLPSTWLNLYRGRAIEPAPGDWGIIAKFLKEVVCADDQTLYEYLLRWIAHFIQRPGELPGKALVLRSDEGWGKNSFVRLLAAIYHQAHYLEVQRLDDLFGAFNSQLQNKLLVFANEATFGGSKASEGALKALITDEKIFINPKHIAGFQCANFARLIVASNNAWPVPVGLQNRRFVCSNLSGVHAQDGAYFRRLHEAARGGELAAMAYDLMRVDVTDFVLERVPTTGNADDLKRMSAPAEVAFVAHMLETGEVGEYEGMTGRHRIFLDDDEPVSVPRSDVFRDFAEFCRSTRKYGTEIQLAKFLKELKVSTTRPRKDAITCRGRHYTFPPWGALRENFKKETGLKIDAEAEEEAPVPGGEERE